MLAPIFDAVRAAGTLFYPPACAICSAATEPRVYLCAACAEKVTRIVPPFCSICSEPFTGAIEGEFSCANCAERKMYFQSAVAACRSRGVVRKVLLDFKYRRHIHLRHLVGEWLCAAMEDDRLRDRTFELIIAVPLHPARERYRGFNQAELIADILARCTGIKRLRALERVRHTTTQTAFDRSERMANLRDAFRLRDSADVRGCRVLLVDDVLTTGSTLNECARVLKRAGASLICAATAARA